MPSPVPPVDFGQLAPWCETYLGSPARVELLRSGYLSAVVGLRLMDGREVVVKVRPSAPRLEACVAVQARVAATGFPCPTPLTGVTPFGAYAAMAGLYVPGGSPLPASGRLAAPFAEAFATLMSCAPRPNEVGNLGPAPSWVAWSHDGERLWPRPEDYDVDLNRTDGPPWLRLAGHAARDRLRAGADDGVVGHCDWYAGNLGWRNNDLVVVHDWDSIIVDTEAALVGFAAAVYPGTDAGGEATLEETAAFLDAYAAARGRRLSDDEIERSWAAGVWLRAFDTMKQLTVGQSPRSLTVGDARQRLARAGTSIP